MKNYNELPPKGKFIRTAICFPVSVIILIVFYLFLNSRFILGSGFVIKYVLAFAVVIVVGIAQLVTTYKAWKRDDDNYY